MLAFIKNNCVSKIYNNNKTNITKQNKKKKFLFSISGQYKYNIYQDGSDRAKRLVNSEERYAIIQKPLGIVLEEAEDGMVCIAKISPNGNAAKSGFDIRVGDIIVAVSATFGDEVWSTRGVGLEMVLKSIKIRSGDFVTLILENANENENQKNLAAENALQRRKDAREKFGSPVVLDPITLTPLGEQTKNQKKGNFFKFF
jgi:C-terminal processing protease CtpA/Prc